MQDEHGPYNTEMTKLSQAIQSYYRTGQGRFESTYVSHHILADILNHFAYKRHEQDREAVITIIHEKEEVAKLRLCSLGKHTKSSFVQNHTLRMGLISARHPGMDHIIDGVLIHNAHLSKLRTTHEQVRYCYKESSRWLRDIKLANISCLQLFHTGYQPAVIGFYQALIEEKQRKNYCPLQVIPYYYDDAKHHYWRGKTWL